MPTLSDNLLFKIKESNDIVDVLSQRMRLKKAGRNYKGLCPFHSEKSPSFSVNPDKQFYHCFGCGEGGDVFTFLMKYENISFFEAAKSLATSAGIEIPKKENYGDKKRAELSDKLFAANKGAAGFFAANLKGGGGKRCLGYFEKRGMSPETIDKFKLGYALDSWDGLLKHLKGKGHVEENIEKAGLIIKKDGQAGYYDRFRNRAIFPIESTGGNIIGFGGRVLDDKLPKYLNSPETPVFNKGHNLYALNHAKEEARRLGYLIIVEGYLDAITPYQAGVKNIAATLGTALTENHIRLIKRYVNKVVLIFDPDEAGVKAVLRGLDLFLATDMKVNVVALKDNLDPDNFVKKHGKDAFLKELRQSVKILDFFIDYTIDKRQIRSIDDKVSIANETLPKISLVKNSIERDYYIKRLAERLQVDEALLRQEMVKESASAAGRPKRNDRFTTPKALRAPILNAEETLLKVVLADFKYAARLKELISSEDFMSATVKTAVERLFALLEKGKELTVDLLLKDVSDDIRRVVSKLIVEESLSTGEELERAFSESLFKVRETSMNSKLNEVRSLIVKATEEKNEKLKDELLREYAGIEKIKRELSKS